MTIVDTLFLHLIIIEDKMNSKIQKWGNSLAIRLPKHVADSMNLRKNDLITISIENNVIIIKPANKYHYKLEDLLKSINENNIHSETETGFRRGNEIW